ncbi:hypothetical protein BDW74DRAFT_169001 [Aspergillus multicolor]|uniref:uncharacterized protein n=1 Tax=Aspergillus multicolor TaxID=41759 RepID=UPI003CCE530A
MASQPSSNVASTQEQQPVPTKPRPQRRQRPDYRQIHRFPLPLTVHPLPPLIPHNPISVISVLLSYLTYYIAPPHHDIHSAYFDSNTSSVHVTDEKTIRALWEMGFFGKGSLSRSEPSWLEQEKKRRGLLGGVTSEEVTRQRRAERRDLKLQRARSEKLIIEQRLQAEAAAREGRTIPGAQADPSAAGATNGTAITAEKFSVKKAREAKFLEARQLAQRDREAAGNTVHFSSTDDNDPTKPTVNGPEIIDEMAITNEEHLQLSNEEAFFLVYGLGSLHIFDHDHQTVLSPTALLRKLCHHSYSPPRDSSTDLKTDDPFLLSYVVYHHFRSLGWVVRSGVKFGVDYLLYNRGPVFSHAEFAIVVIPSYGHPYWSETEERKTECAAKQARSWWWFHCVNRVQAQVKKTLVVCYVEIPPPTQDLEATSAGLDIGALLSRYSDDSLNIAKLQRDALGLESQPFLIELKTIREHRASPDSITLPHTADSVSTSDPPDVIDKSPIHGALRVRNTDNDATGLVDTNKESPEHTSRPALQEPFAAKMGSAETLPSDTQVISQSVYDEIIRKNKEAGNDGPDSNVFDRNTLVTLHDGDSAHIDLLSGFDAAQIHAPNTDENEYESSSKLGESSPLPYERNHFPESQRFLAKTPLTATKQQGTGAVSTISPLVSRNPLAFNFESASGVMALSQVFKATQAPSSPLVNGLQSELLSDRPSPNIPIQNRALAPSLSSPFNTLAATFPRESSDTQLNYVTMKESQANRNGTVGRRMTRSADHIYSEDQSDGEFDKEPSFLERMKRQRRIDEEAAPQFAMLSAPARPSSDLETPTERRITSSRSLERRESEESRTTVVHREQQGPAVDLQAAGASEEDTEQEDEFPKPTPRSQVPNSSTEEDKENFNDPSAVVLSQTERAHDRLSQALSFHESPADACRSPTQTLRDTRLFAQTVNPVPEAVDVDRSSPISVVKDSQWSPERDDVEQAVQTIVESPGNRSQTRLRDSQSRSAATAGHRLGRLSPAKRFSGQPSTQGSQVYNGQSQDVPAATLPRSEIADSAKSANASQQSSAGPHAGTKISTNVVEIGERVTAFDLQGKSSSIPSRVAETPVHRRQRSANEVPPFATIPETSPTRLNNEGWMSDANNEAVDQEDDDLPPPYPRALEQANQPLPVVSQSSSPVKHLLNSKILSSPSGRQRRALTEIAADASPQVGTAGFDLDMDIMSAEDHEFRSAVALSPVPPRKKRRANDGRMVLASDPVIPITPRAEPDLTPLEEDEVTAAPPKQHEEPAIQRPSTFLRHPKPPRRAGSIWDTEDSPRFRISSKERSQIFARSQARERRPSPVLAPEPKETPQPTSACAQAPVDISSTPVREASSNELAVEESPADIGRQPAPESAIVAPNQVLAAWRGQKRAYYPAICLGAPFGTSQDQYMVRFEDSAPVEVPKGVVKQLELRVGDAVKVDMPNVPKVTHIVRGFADKLSAEEAAKTVTDVYGHATLVVGQKQRKSLPNGAFAGPENVINVPVSRIYLDTILWNRIKDRLYTYSSGSGSSESRLQTPSDRHITPTSPSTRLSRSFRPSTGLFSGMIFAVSYGDKSEAKYRVTKMILENDGRILEDGFNELFDLPSNAPMATPTKATAAQSTRINHHLCLKPAAEETGFACLIADKHSRRPKYMQALALNIPCLSDRWIEDCVAKGRVVDWELYLLPAGESTYLNGATRSRILSPYPAISARLSETVAARPNLLNGQSVLFIAGRNGKADEERRKAYIFLTYALGACKIERVPDIQSARAVLHTQSQTGQETSTWDWVYIDDDDKATKALATSSGAVSSKRRRKSRPTEAISGDDLGLNRNIRIVGYEFVCQSLILGRLVDQ